MNGVDVVLQAVAMYKSKDPKSSDEEEMVENFFDCLHYLLTPLENKERFVMAEGVTLMIIIMKQKKLAYGSATSNTYGVEGEPANITEPVAEAIRAAFAIRCPFLDAMKIFDEMSERTIFTWNTMMDAYLSSGKYLEVLELYKEMRVLGMSRDAFLLLCLKLVVLLMNATWGMKSMV